MFMEPSTLVNRRVFVFVACVLIAGCASAPPGNLAPDRVEGESIPLDTFKIRRLPRFSRSCMSITSLSGRWAAKIKWMPAARAFTPSRCTAAPTAAL